MINKNIQYYGQTNVISIEVINSLGDPVRAGGTHGLTQLYREAWDIDCHTRVPFFLSQKKKNSLGDTKNVQNILNLRGVFQEHWRGYQLLSRVVGP